MSIHLGKFPPFCPVKQMNNTFVKGIKNPVTIGREGIFIMNLNRSLLLDHATDFHRLISFKHFEDVHTA